MRGEKDTFDIVIIFFVDYVSDKSRPPRREIRQSTRQTDQPTRFTGLTDRPDQPTDRPEGKGSGGDGRTQREENHILECGIDSILVVGNDGRLICQSGHVTWCARLWPSVERIANQFHAQVSN